MKPGAEADGECKIMNGMLVGTKLNGFLIVCSQLLTSCAFYIKFCHGFTG